MEKSYYNITFKANNMKIIYFHDAIARLGGVERVFVEKMNFLAEKYNQEVYLITTCQGNHPFSFPLSNKVTHIDLSVRFHTKYQYSIPKRLYVGWKMDKELIVKLNNIVNEIDADIIITTSYYKADTICQLKCRAKKIIESHIAKNFNGINDGIERNIISRVYRKWQINRSLKTIEKESDAIIALTNGDAKDWNAKKVIVIPNIVDLNNRDHSLLINKVALFAGRLLYQKGLDRMLAAWKIVVDKRNDWTLKFIGDGELKDALIKQCKTLGIENNVVFEGTSQNMVQEYCNSSVFLLTSRFEGFGLVLAEAMQCGVPCVSFDCPHGPADIIDNGKNGILVENGNIEDFANAVLKLIDNEELRIRMGKAAIEKAKDYLPETIMPQWIKLFNQLTNGK